MRNEEDSILLVYHSVHWMAYPGQEILEAVVGDLDPGFWCEYARSERNLPAGKFAFLIATSR